METAIALISLAITAIGALLAILQQLLKAIQVINRQRIDIEVLTNRLENIERRMNEGHQQIFHELEEIRAEIHHHSDN